MVVISDSPVIDLAFPLRSAVSSPTPVTIPADHGYALFSAISHALPFLHGNDTVAVHPVEGRLVGNRQLQLQAYSAVTLRLSTNLIGAALPLAGATLDVQGAIVRLAAPRVVQLAPAAALRSRVVIIKGMLDAATLAAAARRQLDALGVAGALSIPVRRVEGPVESAGIGSRDTFRRTTVQVRDKVIVGYAMTIEELTAEESICLQENGIGGRQRFGCGVFSPYGRS